MTKLSTRLPADNEKLQPLVGEISWSKNLIIMASGKDNLKREFYHVYRDLPKVQPLVAQIGWSHNLNVFQRCKYHLERELELLNAEQAKLAATYRMLKRLPKELKGQLPSPDEIAKLLGGVE